MKSAVILKSALLLAAGLLAAGCSQSAPKVAPPSETPQAATDTKPVGEGKPIEAEPAPPEVREVTISIAASTKDAIEALVKEYQTRSGAKVNVNAGPSSELANQLIAGAPAGLFLSASQKWADAVKEKGQVVAARRLLTNKLVIVVPKGNPAQVKQPADLLNEPVKRIALAGENVPAGTYADQALTKLDLLKKLVDANKISRGKDVRTALAFVERGEAEAGIVYASDVSASDAVEQVYEFPSDLHDEIVYVLVLLKEGEQNQSARALYDFLQSPEAATEFQKLGFQMLDDKKAP